MTTYSYYAIGATAAGLVNVETYTQFPPRSTDGNATPLTGNVRRRALSGRPRSSGWINGMLFFDGMTRDAYNALVYAVFGGFATAGVERYFTLFDDSGHFSPYRGFIERVPSNFADDSTLLSVTFPLYNLTLQSVTKTGNATLTASERLVYVDTGSGNVTITLMAASAVQANTVVSVQKTAAANTLSIARGGTDTINAGTASLSVTAQYARVDLVSDGVSAWTTL